jgi:hypothetical protein
VNFEQWWQENYANRIEGITEYAELAMKKIASKAWEDATKSTEPCRNAPGENLRVIS